MSPRSFILGGKRGGELHDPVVEERETPLDRVRHGYPVPLRGEDVTRQQVGRLEVLGPRQGVPAEEGGGQAGPQVLDRVVARQGIQQVVGEEPNDAGRRGPAGPVREERIVWLVEANFEERSQVGSRLTLEAGQVRVEAAEQQRPPR